MSTMQADAAALEGAPAVTVPGRHVSAGMGWTWIAEGWRLFLRAPLMWIIAMVIVFIAMIVVGFIPLLGAIVMPLLQTLFFGGFMYACLALDRGGEFELEHLFAGFSRRFVPLLIVGALYMLGTIAIMLVMMAFVGVSILPAFMAGDTDAAMAAMAASVGTLMLGGLVALALTVPLMAAFWFAPALVMINGMAPVAAMKASFFACFRNFIPFILYGIIMTVLAILAMIPIFLGFLVWVPVLIASVYTGYRSIFTAAGGAAHPVATP
jgi:hypothetical protein